VFAFDSTTTTTTTTMGRSQTEQQQQQQVGGGGNHENVLLLKVGGSSITGKFLKMKKNTDRKDLDSCTVFPVHISTRLLRLRLTYHYHIIRRRCHNN
jgi:hypothetical protein